MWEWMVGFAGSAQSAQGGAGFDEASGPSAQRAAQNSKESQKAVCLAPPPQPLSPSLRCCHGRCPSGDASRAYGDCLRIGLRELAKRKATDIQKSRGGLKKSRRAGQVDSPHVLCATFRFLLHLLLFPYQGCTGRAPTQQQQLGQRKQGVQLRMLCCTSHAYVVQRPCVSRRARVAAGTRCVQLQCACSSSVRAIAGLPPRLSHTKPSCCCCHLDFDQA